ncbi:MAG TPA: hypothetical protein VGM39_01460 [Kofleriaceae bacterium]
MSKRRWIVGVVGICLAWHGLRHAEPEKPAKPPVLQIAVLQDGFGIAEAMNDRHLIEVDIDGKRRKRWAIPLVGDMRIVGTRLGSTLAWIDTKNKILRLGALKEDGKLGRTEAFGRDAAQLCNGAASTSTGFAIMWRATNGGFWFLRGSPEGRSEAVALSDAKVSEEDAAAPMACAVRPAGDGFALFFRSGRHMDFDICTASGCQNMLARVPVKPGDQIEDLACQATGCAAALSSSSGVRLVGFDFRGKVRWTTALTPVTGQDVHLAAAPRSYLVSYKAPDQNRIDRVLATTGSRELFGHTHEELSVPVVTVSRTRAALAWLDRGVLGTAVGYID